MTLLVDSHCHLGDLTFGDVEQDFDEVIANAQNAGVTHMLCVNTDLGTFPAMYERIKDLPNVYASVGTHPLNINDYKWSDQELIDYARYPKVIAVGEIGLDYYYDEETKEAQQEVFARQIRLAKQVKKPIIIHGRCAKDDLFRIVVEENAAEVGGIFHCFADDWDLATKVLDLGFYISVSGIVTFKKAQNIKDLAVKIPLDRLLLETDSPYLAPVPYRGKPNQPAYVKQVAEEVARLRNMEVEDLCNKTSENFARLFNLELEAK